MNNLLKICLLIMIILINTLYSKTIKISFANNMEPFYFLDKDKKAKGLLIDYWTLWAEKSNIKIEFINNNWSDALELVKNNKADIHAGLLYIKKIEKELDYIGPIYEFSLDIYINKKNINKIKSINDLSGKVVAVIKGSHSSIYLKTYYPKIKLKEYSSYSQMISSIYKNLVDGVISKSLTIGHSLIKSSKFTEIIRLKDFKVKSMLYAAIPKNNKELKILILNGIKKIRDEELSILEKKWIIDKNYRVYKEVNKKDILTKGERLYLNTNKNLKLAFLKNWKPMSFYNDKNEISGFHIDLLNQINKNLDSKIKYKIFDTWTEAYSQAKNLEINGIFGLAWSEKREEIFSYSKAYYFSPRYLIMRQNDKTLINYKTISNKVAVVQKSSISEKVIKKYYPNNKIIYLARKEIFSFIKNKSADFTIQMRKNEYELKKNNLSIKKIFYTKEGEFHIGTGKKDKIFTSIINKGINSLSRKQLEEINKKWFNKKDTESIFTKEELEYIEKCPVLKVGIEEWAPIVFTKDLKNIDGIAGEILELIFKKSGLKIKLIRNKWHLLLKDFKNKKIDILPVTYYLKDRSLFGLYTDSYLSIKGFIYVKEDNNNVTSFKDLNGKKIALLKDSASIEYIKKKFPDIKIIETLSIEEAILKVLNSEVSAIYGSKIAIEHKLSSLLITGLKDLSQDSIKSNKIHLLIKKDDLILKSILEKSIYSVPLDKKNEIINKWINPKKVKTSVTIALNIGREPYVLDKTYLKGIEYELLSLILKRSNIDIKKIKKLSLKDQDKAFDEDFELDLIVSVKEKKDNYYYSKDFIIFEHVVVTRKKDNIKINEISDLKGKNIIAFEGASLYLPKEYRDIFSKIPNKYNEEIIQEKQVEDFLDKKADVIILDKNTFKWFLRKLSNRKLEEYKFDNLFPIKNKLKVVFRNKEIKNLFDKNLTKIKESGEYKKIIDSYMESDIFAKVKINTLLSSVFAELIYKNDIKSINAIIRKFENLSFINKIEVFSDELISSSSNDKYKVFMQQDAYFTILNIPNKVGFIRVYFNEKDLLIASEKSNIIPSIIIFNDLDSYSHIKSIYKKFNYLNKRIEFTKKEKSFINKNKTIKYSEISWEPLVFIKNGKTTGIFYDYINVLEKYSNLKFEFVESKTLKDVANKLKNKIIDFVPVSDFNNMNIYSNTSESFLSFNYVLVMKKENKFVKEINELKDKLFVLPKSYLSYKIIKNNYPSIQILHSETGKESLELISLGKADVTLIHESIAVLYIQKFFPNLKVVGITKYKFNHKFSVHKNNPIILSIINKLISHVSQKEHKEIKDKWINYKVSTAVDYTVIYQMLFIFLLVLSIVLYFFKRISNNKNKILKMNNKLEDTISILEKTKIDLNEQKDLFEALFKGTSDGLALIEDGVTIHSNYSLLKMYKVDNISFLDTYKFGSLSPKIQPNGNNSIEVYTKYLNLCKVNNYSSYDSLVYKSTGEEFWVNIILIKIETNKRNLIYSITRDISEKRFLEEEIQNKANDLEVSNNELEDSNEELQTTIQNLKQTQEQLVSSEKMAALGALVAGVAHEINTPVGIGLTGISHLEDSTKIIHEKYNQDEMSQEEFEEYLDTAKDLSSLVHKNLEKAASLVKSFKQVAVDQSSEAKRVFDIKEYLDEILQSIHSVTKKTNIDIEVSCPSGIKINSYAGAYSQIISNLIMNSLIHGFKEKEKGNIFITVEKKEKELKIIYKDTGKGIKEENLSKIFDPFFTTNRDNGGSGLGLNIIYNIIMSRLNGSIKCNSQENKGVEFIIILNI